MSASSQALWAISDGDDPSTSAAGAGRVLGTHLRRLRKERGLRLVDVVKAGVVGSPPTLSRIENALTPLQEQQVLALARFYGVTEPGALDILSDLARRSLKDEWWGAFRDVVPGWLERLISVEAASRAIRTYEVQYVPGLLQTSEYARTLLRQAFPVTEISGAPSERDIDRRVEVRRRRQSLLQQTSAPLFYALLDEAVLARPVGGKAVMREQLRHLYSLEENRERVHIRILPFAQGDKAMAPAPSITYLEAHPGRDVEMVYLELPDGGTYLTAPKEVVRYKAALTGLWREAANRNESLAIMTKYIDKLAE